MIKLVLSATCASLLMIPMSFAAESNSKAAAQPSAVANCGGCEKKKDCDKKDGCDKKKPEGALADGCGKCKKGEEKKEEKKTEGTLVGAGCGKCKKGEEGKEEKKAEGTLADGCGKCKKGKDGKEEKEEKKAGELV